MVVDRVFTPFGIPEKLHSDQGKEFENRVVCQLQTPLEFEKTRTAPFRTQGSSASEQARSNLRLVLAVHSSVEQDN